MEIISKSHLSLSTQMVQNLEGDGFTMVPFGQGFKDMSPPSKELMRIVLERKLNHGGHPVLRWNFDNVYVRTDPAGNIKPIPHRGDKALFWDRQNWQSLCKGCHDKKTGYGV